MWIRASGEIGENSYLVTTETSSHLLAGGQFYALIDSGVTICSDSLIKSIKKILDIKDLKFILLTEASYDNVGGIAKLRELNPSIELLANKESLEKLSDKNFIKSAIEFNKEVSKSLKSKFKGTIKEWTSALKVDRVLSDGDEVDLGYEVSIKVIKAPGHSKDTTAYHLRPDKVIAAGEAFGGYHGKDKTTPAFSYSYRDYLKSIDSLATLEIKTLVLPHLGAITGSLVGKFLLDARVSAENLILEIKKRLDSGSVVSEVVASILQNWEPDSLSPEGPFRTLRDACLENMVKAVANKTMS